MEEGRRKTTRHSLGDAKSKRRLALSVGVARLYAGLFVSNLFQFVSTFEVPIALPAK